MSEYKGYDVSTTTLHGQGAGVTEATVPGPFHSEEDAHSAAEAVARWWIDRQGK